jgi:hypothetical protein
MVRAMTGDGILWIAVLTGLRAYRRAAADRR